MTRFQLGEKENQLLHSIYAAALAPEKWRSVIEAIMIQIGSDSAQLIFYDSKYPGRNLAETVRIDIQSPELPGSFKMDINEIKELFGGWQEGAVIFSHSISSHVSGKNTCDNALNSSGPYAVIPLINSSHVASMLGFYSINQQCCLSPEALQFLHRLAPHFSKALHIYNQVSAVKNSNLSLVESLKCSQLGIMLLDDHLHVIYATEEARRILEKNPALHINRYEQLEIKDSRQKIYLDEQLQKLLAMADVPSQSQEFNMPLRVPEKVHPLKLTAVLLDNQEYVRSNKVRIAIFLNDPDRQRFLPLDYLQQAFALTRTEGAIAQMLLGGDTINEIAGKRHTSVETARWQLKSILHKTNTGNQAELTRLLMLISHDVASNPLLIDQPAIHTTHLGDD
jgi:DNA-binding CsgD family transcriptional regulator